jgi:hypothetical protein
MKPPMKMSRRILSATKPLLFGDQLTEIQVTVQKASKARESARRAQQKFRNRQKEKKRLQKDQIEAQNRELKKEQERRTSLEQQLQQMKAENAQLKLRLDRSEEYCTVLQGSVETLRKSLDLLCGDTNGSQQGSNRPSTGHMTLSPSTSQFGHKNQISPRPLSQLPNYLSKHAPSLHVMSVVQF